MCQFSFFLDLKIHTRLLPVAVGPPIIGDEARLEFPKIRAICSDKFSKFCPKMFGLNQAFAKNVKFCSDCPSGLQKQKICSDRLIWPPKKYYFTYFTKYYY